MNISDITSIFDSLRKSRWLFWSEDDFKFAFALELKAMFPKANVRLEKRYSNAGNNCYTDIVAVMDRKSYPIELKYKTTEGIYADVSGEHIDLRTHSAVDLGCYSYLKDIERLEFLANVDTSFERGFAIILTNESLYYRNTGRTSVYNDFKIYEGRYVTGQLNWGVSRYNGNIPSWAGSHPSITLNGLYKMEWKNYGGVLNPASGNYPSTQFKYQVAVINKKLSSTQLLKSL